MTIRVRKACFWGWRVLSLSAGCGGRETPTTLETQDGGLPAIPVGKSKIATATREDFLMRLHAAFSEGGRKPVELVSYGA